MSKSDEIAEEIRLMDDRIETYKQYLHLRNSGQIAITDRATQIDIPTLEKQALEHYRRLLLFHWSLEFKKEKEKHNE